MKKIKVGLTSHASTDQPLTVPAPSSANNLASYESDIPRTEKGKMTKPLSLTRLAGTHTHRRARPRARDTYTRTHTMEPNADSLSRSTSPLRVLVGSLVFAALLFALGNDFMLPWGPGFAVALIWVVAMLGGAAMKVFVVTCCASA